MLQKIKRKLSSNRNEVTNSVLFWNAMYYVVLGITAIFSLEWAMMLYGLSSILALGFIFDGDGYENNFWLMTTLPVLFILTIFGIGFCIGYPIYKLVNWFNRVLDGETCLKHKYKRTSELPPMVEDSTCASSYPVTYTCQKCGKEKETRSDLMLGMRLIKDDEGEI